MLRHSIDAGMFSIKDFQEAYRCMAVNYVCRHCRTFIGRIDAPDISEERLGFHFLTPSERRDIIAYNSSGEITVRITCDYCKENLEDHPELSLLANPLQ